MFATSTFLVALTFDLLRHILTYILINLFAGADVNLSDYVGKTPLYICVNNCIVHSTMGKMSVEKLIGAGAIVDKYVFLVLCIHPPFPHPSRGRYGASFKNSLKIATVEKCFLRLICIVV